MPAIPNAIPLLNTIIPEDKNTIFTVDIQGLFDRAILIEQTLVELKLTESLLSPATMATITFNDVTHSTPLKNYDQFAGKKIVVKAERPILAHMGFGSKLEAEYTIYRMADRSPINYGLEKYNLHACHDTLLRNSEKRVSKSWNCETPDVVVDDVLTKCIGVPQKDVQKCDPSRTYFAPNIHPFQVIAQQADVALDTGSDPSFLHFMSTMNKGTHHFRSLQNLTNQGSVFAFMYSEKGAGAGYANPGNIMSYNFPCDFDILSDIENGVTMTSDNSWSALIYNTFTGARSMFGIADNGCGMGGSVFDDAPTNQGSGPEAGTCESNSERYMLKRQARLSLLDQDKVALQIVVPFNPNLFAGSMISVGFINKNPVSTTPELDYGSGDYLISTLTHNLKSGGFGVTILDLVSKSVGLGRV